MFYGALRGRWRRPGSYAQSAELQGVSRERAGRKNSAQLFHFFMRLRIVSASQPAPMSRLAICCEYHTSVLLGRCFLKLWYAFRQRSYLACVSSFRASRLASVGV